MQNLIGQISDVIVKETSFLFTTSSDYLDVVRDEVFRNEKNHENHCPCNVSANCFSFHQVTTPELHGTSVGVTLDFDKNYLRIDFTAFLQRNNFTAL